MKESDNKLEVGMINELCPICTEKVSSPIIMNKKLTKAEAKKIKDLHGGNVWSKTLCDKCIDMKSKGFILIGAVEAKTTDTTNPYRSGNIWCVKQKVAEDLFAPHGAPKSGVAFIDVTVAEQMKLPNVNLNA